MAGFRSLLAFWVGGAAALVSIPPHQQQGKGREALPAGVGREARPDVVGRVSLPTGTGRNY